MSRSRVRRFILAGLALLALALVACAITSLPSCGGRRTATFADARITRVGTIDHKAVKESSGLVASRQHPGVFWTHNDQGNAPLLFAITREGKFISEFRLNSKQGDWEDIAADDQGRLYLAMIGNNERKRTEVQVARIDEPEPLANNPKAKATRIRQTITWRLTYPDGPFDSESLFVHDNFGYIITKVAEKTAATIYRFPLTETANPIVLEKVATIPVHSPVTAAGLSRDAAHLAVLSRSDLHVFRVAGDIASTAAAQPIRIPLPNLQFEGCCFTKEGILLSAESRELYLVPAAAYQ